MIFLIKLDCHRLFSCGFGETFALGHGDSKNLTEFKQINFIKTTTSRPHYPKNEEIEKIACGLTHSACIKNGKIYMWGLYSNNDAMALKVPTLIDFSSNGTSFIIFRNFQGNKKKEDLYFVDIKLGDTLSVFLTSKGEVYTMGENIDGQLGVPNISSADSPIRVSHLPIAANQVISIILQCIIQ